MVWFDFFVLLVLRAVHGNIPTRKTLFGYVFHRMFVDVDFDVDGVEEEGSIQERRTTFGVTTGVP